MNEKARNIKEFYLPVSSLDFVAKSILYEKTLLQRFVTAGGQNAAE